MCIYEIFDRLECIYKMNVEKSRHGDSAEVFNVGGGNSRTLSDRSYYFSKIAENLPVRGVPLCGLAFPPQRHLNTFHRKRQSLGLHNRHREATEGHRLREPQGRRPSVVVVGAGHCALIDYIPLWFPRRKASHLATETNSPWAPFATSLSSLPPNEDDLELIFPWCRDVTEGGAEWDETQRLRWHAIGARLRPE